MCCCMQVLLACSHVCDDRCAQVKPALGVRLVDVYGTCAIATMSYLSRGNWVDTLAPLEEEDEDVEERKERAQQEDDDLEDTDDLSDDFFDNDHGEL